MIPRISFIRLSRYTRGSYFPPYGGPDGRKLSRKLLYSKFRPVKTYRLELNSAEERNTFQR